MSHHDYSKDHYDRYNYNTGYRLEGAIFIVCFIILVVILPVAAFMNWILPEGVFSEHPIVYTLFAFLFPVFAFVMYKVFKEAKQKYGKK